MAKTIEKNVVHPKSTLARPTIYDRALPENLSTASTGNPVSITKPTSLLLFVQPGKKFFEESTKVKETHFWQFSAINTCEKIAHSRNMRQNSLQYTLLLNSSDMDHLEACWARQTLYNAKVYLKIQFFV